MWCNSDADTDSLFSDQCIGSLRRILCEPQLLPDIKARRTVILRQIDDTILNKSSSNVTSELQQCDSWLSLVDLYIFPNSPANKLTCFTNETATRALTGGVRMFNLSIPPANIVQEEFISLTTCYRCYAIEDHQASSCSKSKNFKICSVCAMTGHTYKHCTSTTKKCLNCSGAHTSLAMACPERKRRVAIKKNILKQHKTYANAFAASSRPTPLVQPISSSSDVMFKAFMCITLSTMKNAEAPGTLEQTLNNLLRVNGLPSISIGDLSPPSMGCLVEANSKTVNLCDKEKPLFQAGPKSSCEVEKRKNKHLNDQPNNNSSTVPTVIYKKKNVSARQPNNAHDLFATGSILLDCASGDEEDCLQSLSTIDKDDFANSVTITELKSREFDQKAGLFKPKRTLRNIGSSQPV